MTIKQDIRDKVIKMAQEGLGRNKIAQGLNLSQGSVSNILKEKGIKVSKGKNNQSTTATINQIAKSPSEDSDISIITNRDMNNISPRFGVGLPLIDFRDGPPLEFIKNEIALQNGTGIEQTSEDLEIKLEEYQDARQEEGIWSDSQTDGEKLSMEEQQEQNELDSEISDLDRELMKEELEDLQNSMGLDSEERQQDEDNEWF